MKKKDLRDKRPLWEIYSKTFSTVVRYDTVEEACEYYRTICPDGIVQIYKVIVWEGAERIEVPEKYRMDVE
jgi:hypothetical protein